MNARTLKLVCPALATLIMLTAGTVRAATLTTFSDKAAFLTATGATSATGPLPSAGSTVPSLTIGDLTFSAVSPWSMNFQETWTALLPGIDMAINGVEHLDVDLATPVGAFGFDFVEPGVGSNDSNFQVSLFSDATNLGSFIYNAPNDVAAFVGVLSDVAFNRVEIRDLPGTSDDEFYGEFFTAAPATVPEPSTLLLLGTGLVGLVGYGRRKRRA